MIVKTYSYQILRLKLKISTRMTIKPDAAIAVTLDANVIWLKFIALFLIKVYFTFSLPLGNYIKLKQFCSTPLLNNLVKKKIIFLRHISHINFLRVGELFLVYTSILLICYLVN